MARLGLLATFEAGFYDAWAPVRPELHHWRDEMQPVVVFQVIWAEREVKQLVSDMLLAQARDVYGVGYNVGEVTKRALITPGEHSAG